MFHYFLDSFHYEQSLQLPQYFDKSGLCFMHRSQFAVKGLSPVSKDIADTRRTHAGSSHHAQDFMHPAVYMISVGSSLGCYYY